jgi:hypothetical protein
MVAQDLKNLRPIGNIEKMDVETIYEIPKSIIAEEESHDVFNKLQSYLSSKKAMVAHKEISNDSVSSHNSIVRYVACLKDNERHLVEFGKNPDFISRTVFRKKISIDYFVNVSNKVSLHFKKDRNILSL